MFYGKHDPKFNLYESLGLKVLLSFSISGNKNGKNAVSTKNDITS